MNNKEAEHFIRTNMPLMIKDKKGNLQYPFKSVNAYEQVCKHLIKQLVKSNGVSCSASKSFSKDDLLGLGGWFDGSPEFVEEVVNKWLNSR